MDKELLEKLGIEVTEEMSEDDIKKAVTDKIDEKDKHITELEDEKKRLSEDNQALTTSVEGYKSSEEKLSKEGREKAFLHAMKHIDNNDFFKDDIQKIEFYAHTS